MPSRDTLESFVATVVSGKHDQAIADFYTPGASMQENLDEERKGRDGLVARERAVMAMFKSIGTTCVRPVFVDGDRVVIRWIFEFDWLDGSRTRMEELAWQRWRGERIAEERFFYDPAQLVPRRPEA